MITAEEKRFHTHSSCDRYFGTRAVTTSPANSTSPLLVLSPPATSVAVSSIPHGWNGILVEKHVSPAGECRATSIDRHVLALVSGFPARVEQRTFVGTWHSCVNRTAMVTAIPAGDVPERRLHNAAEFIYCAIDISLVDEVEAESGHPAGGRLSFGDEIHDQSAGRIIRLLSNELQRSTVPDRLFAESLGHALAVRYVLAGVSPIPAARTTCSALPPRLLNRVCEKIGSQLEADLSLQELAQESGYSRAHFLRMFRTATGMTPHQYILELRLKKAREHLRRREMTVADIAATCGFSSQSHMTSAFRKHLSVTPAEYRRGL